MRKFAPVEFDRLFNVPDKEADLDPSKVGDVRDWRFANATCLDPVGNTTFGWRSFSPGEPSFSAVTCFDEGEQRAFEFNAEAVSS